MKGYMKRTAKEVEQNKKNILLAALDVFAEKGFNSTKMEDIATRANSSRGAIYWHFKNKQEIFIYLLKKGYKEVDMGLEDIFTKEISHIEKIREYMRTFLSFVANNSLFRSICKIAYLSQNEIKEYYEKIYQDLKYYHTKTVLDLVLGSMKDGDISSDRDPKVVTLEIICFLDGVQYVSITGEELKLYKVIDTMVDDFLKILK
jgi:TetR/AcrR family acrAB operon transcriptional repressor